jgi:hypothetical protein
MWIKGEVGGKYEYESACVGHVEFRTNGPQGGDAGHGGFLEISFDTSRCSTALDANVDGSKFDNVERLTFTFRGDAEMNAAVECFEYLARELRRALG